VKLAATIDERALASIFLEARTFNAFEDRPVPQAVLERALDLALLGPTASNSLPLRIVFVQTEEGKARLKPALSAGNVDKTMAAPVTAIVAADLRFFEYFPRTAPGRGEQLAARFETMEAPARRDFARDNAILQMGYFIVAARAVGLDAGPMGGFERDKVDAEFFPDGRWISLYLINLGYGDPSGLRPRQPRLPANDIARYE
jgi:3-hydroxypropanoate dehydrogenase